MTRSRDILAIEGRFDLLLLDLALPGKDGLEILAKVREVQPTLPVIIMTARGDEADRVKGLKLGADDYIVKPVGLAELLARVEAVLRRSPQRPAVIETMKLPGGEIDLSRSEVRFDDGSRAELSEREHALLDYLMRHPRRVISRQEILQNVWRLDPRGLSTRAVDMLVVRLREKLRDDAHRPTWLLTIRGKGYMIAASDAMPAEDR
jgi:DNA-binding response OmpR family regulator